MIVSLQGFGHFTNGINNQDSALETRKMLLVADGCSSGEFSELGTKRFTQLFKTLEGCDEVGKFEKNVEIVMTHLAEADKMFYPEEKKLQAYIMDNFLFTIVAVFETEDQYILKLFGDGYVVTENASGNISYIKFSYGKYPPYYAYKFCKYPDLGFGEKTFKTVILKKEDFTKVVIATDGIETVIDANSPGFDKCIVKASDEVIRAEIKSITPYPYDDITIARLGGIKDE